PLTAYTVSVACVALPKNPGTVTSQLLNVCVRPFAWVTSLIWNTPARLVFGPCSGVPSTVGVVERRTTSPGAAEFGPGWKLVAFGSLYADENPESSEFAAAVRACSEMPTLNVPPTPAVSPAPGETMLAATGVVRAGGAWTGLPAAETGSQRPPNPVSPSPFVRPGFVSWTK